MHIIWENLMAAILMMSIALTLVVVNARNQEALTETTSFYSLKSQGLAFGEVLKRDMQGVAEVFNHAEVDSSFRFNAYLGQDTTLHTIEYRRRWVSQRQEEQDDGSVETVNFYEIQRYVDGTRRGGSMTSLTDWEILALSEENDTLGVGDVLANCRKLFVRFEAASPLSDTETVRRMRWETTFVPPMRSRSGVL